MIKPTSVIKHTRLLVAVCLVVLVLCLVPWVVTAAPQADTGKWWGDYFANTTLSGAPVLSRYEDAIDFQWSTGAPGPGVPADNFSARWTREEWFQAGTYRFSARSDDGLRVWVGDLMVIDAWQDQQAGWLTRDVHIKQGTYTVRVEYYEHGGDAQVYVGWEPITGGQGWRGEYFANQNLEGSPALIRTDAAIDFAWADGAPDAALPADHFSVRWTRTLGFTPGTYRFSTSTDDGVRLWVDHHLLIDAWNKQKLPNTHSGDITLSGDGLHQITVEYFEQGGEAHAHVWWQRLDGFTGWKGEYFDNKELVGGPALVRDDAEINFDWSTAPPVSWMPDDNFSVRWTRELDFAPGYYRFSVQADDGVRVWLDDALIIDKWQEMNKELHYVDGTYLSGSHRLKIEYFEQNGLASIHFWISAASQTPSQTPTYTTPPKTPSEQPPAPAPAQTQAPWQASYFANRSLQGDPALVRQEAVIDFNWQLGAPDPALPANDFSVRWQSTQDFAEGRYRFTTYSDDGVRLLIDGRPLISSWRPMRGYRSATVDLAAGQHTVVLEYFERAGAAQVRLNWRR